MKIRAFLVAAAACILPSLFGCAAVVKDQAPVTGVSVNYKTQNWFRGAPIHLGGAISGNLSVQQELKNGDFFKMSAWAIADASGDPGDGLATPRNGSDVTEVDLIGSYTKDLGPATATFGLINYSFPNSAGGSTSEAYATLRTDALGFTQRLTAYYDFDAVDDLYVSFAGSKSIPIDERFTLALNGQFGYMGDDLGMALFGVRESGLSDVVLSAQVNYAYDALTTLFAGVSGVANIGSDYKDALDAGGFDTSGAFVTFGASWSL